MPKENPEILTGIVVGVVIAIGSHFTPADIKFTVSDLPPISDKTIVQDAILPQPTRLPLSGEIRIS